MVLYIVWALLFLIIVYFLTALIKTDNAIINHLIIADAIFHYRKDCSINRCVAVVDMSDMESYEATVFRIYDWGYTRILPKDKYELVKPYIGKGGD